MSAAETSEKCPFRDFLRKYANVDEGADLRAAWADDPHLAGANEGLTSAQVGILLSRDVDAIRAELEAEGCTGTYVPASTFVTSQFATTFGLSVRDDGT